MQPQGYALDTTWRPLFKDLGVVPAKRVHAALLAAEISFLLGFDEPNSFYRAFRAWTGRTPDSVRRALSEADAH
jgi:AraC-like DNA-binding protein